MKQSNVLVLFGHVLSSPFMENTHIYLIVSCNCCI